MAEPTLPAGATIAAFVMAVISWYGMLRTGIQFVYDDIKGRKSAEADVWDMLVDLKHQKQGLEDWKRQWRISKHTPDAVLLEFWGADRHNVIYEKLKRIKSDLEKVIKSLGRLAHMENGRWADAGALKKNYHILTFIWAKKKHVQSLLDRGPKNMIAIKEASDAGWQQQEQRLAREIAHIKPYHVQVARLLVQIAMQNPKDAEALRACCQAIRDDVTVFLDLDLFDDFAAVTKDQPVERIEQFFQAGHLKLELLLREADRQRAEFARVVIESASKGEAPESRIVDAFRAMLGTQDSTHRFASNASTSFCLSRYRRAGDPCSTLQQSFRDVLADQNLPTYDAETEQLSNHGTALGELSKARAAFELAQACLLFIRTTWIQELCRCSVRCGTRSRTTTTNQHHFGLELVEIRHQPPPWCNPQDPGCDVIEDLGDSWCMQDHYWYGLNKPLRHLGLLLLEFCLGTAVIPETSGNGDGAAKVSQIRIRVRTAQGRLEWERINLKTVLKLVRQSLNDGERFTGAVEHCLTGTLPGAPPDADMEEYLRDFYFKVVQPYVFSPRFSISLIDFPSLRDIYDIRLSSGLLSS